MRLLSKISYYHFLLSIFVLGITGFMMFIFLRNEISAEIEEQLELQADMVAEEIHRGRTVIFPLVQIHKGQQDLMAEPKIFKDTLIYDRLQNEHEGYYYFAESKAIKGGYYRIKVMTTYIGWENYSRTISYIFLFIAVMLVLLGTLINYFISRGIWTPFLSNLKRVANYSVSTNQDLVLKETDVKEFQEMNSVLSDLAARGKKEYSALKQFTENASHEIQTPLAIAKARLESISQFPLEPKLVNILNDAKAAINRLSRVNKGLLLLAKLENNVFVDQTAIDLNKVISHNYTFFEDLFQQKQLDVTLTLGIKTVNASTSLMDILISNMMSNILQYTPDCAKVGIVLNQQQLKFVNEAPPLSFPESRLFARFNKGEQAERGRNGLGLSIVQRICISNNWEIKYHYNSGSHIFEIRF